MEEAAIPPKRGRPRIHTEPRITTSLRIPEALYQRLKEVASERDTSVSNLIAKAVASYLDGLPPLP